MKLPVPGHQGRVVPWIRVPAFDSVPASTWRPLPGADRQFYALEAHPKKDVLGHQSGYGHSERVGGPGGNGKGTSRNTGWGRMPSGTGTPSSGRMGWGLTTPARPAEDDQAVLDSHGEEGLGGEAGQDPDDPSFREGQTFDAIAREHGYDVAHSHGSRAAGLPGGPRHPGGYAAELAQVEELSEHLAEAASEADEAADSNERILSDTRFRTLDRLQVTIEAGRRAAPEVYAAMEAHGAALEAGDQEAAAEAEESYFRALDSLDGQDAQLVDRALDAGDEYRETSFRLRDEIRAIEANNEVIAEVQERTEPIRQELETRVRRLEGAHAQLLYSAAEDAGIDVYDLDLSDAQLADNLQALGERDQRIGLGHEIEYLEERGHDTDELTPEEITGLAGLETERVSQIHWQRALDYLREQGEDVEGLTSGELIDQAHIGQREAFEPGLHESLRNRAGAEALGYLESLGMDTEGLTIAEAFE